MTSASIQTSPAPTSPAAPATKAAAEPFLLLLCLILLGNAVDGKGFAFLFLGELAIPLGIIVLLRPQIPNWPWAAVPVIVEKEGDVQVHLAGVLAFWVAGFVRKVHPLWIVLLILNLALAGMVDRAGLLAFCVAAGICLIYKPLHPILWSLVGTLALAILLLWATDLHIELPGGKGREISFGQVVSNVGSMFSDSGSEGLDSTKEFRTDWWKEIIRYTVRGPYFWTGKGFGIN